jgi:hypothetical protein
MTEKQVLELYEDLMDTGRQAVEKHIRHAAAKIVEGVKGGFGKKFPREIVIPWHARHGYLDVYIKVPPGCHGFALQMVIEAQIRKAVT